MSDMSRPGRTQVGGLPSLDETDRRILRLLQEDATQPFDRLADKVGVSKTAVWNRIQKLRQDGVIRRQVAIVDGARVGLGEVFFIAVKTSRHSADWLVAFADAVRDMPEIVEAHRLTGEIDYLLKVQVADTRAFDDFYKRMVARIDLFNVTSSLSMEVLKQETALPL